MDKNDIHGRKQLTKSVLSNWSGQLVTIVSGFVVPRLIDRQIGQEALGVWDLAWSVVAYFALVQMGITTSINRYVAFHRAKGDIAGINEATSSAAMIMRIMASVAFLAAIACSLGISAIFGERLGGHAREAQWLVFLLGTGVAVQISSSVFGSVLTGYHRWDLHNGIQAAANVLGLFGMAGALLMGWGLIGLAAVHLGCETLGRIARIIAAHKVCPGLSVSWRNFKRAKAAEMMGFGGKQFLATVSQMILNSGINLMIAGHLGPAALALYARPGALMRNMGTFVNKYAMVFSPTISSLQAEDRKDEIKELALKATQYGLFLSLPFFLFLLVFGGDVLRVWMGAKYENTSLIRTLVWASFFNVAYLPLFKSLVGLNLHGRLGWAYVCACIVGLSSAYLALAKGSASLITVAVIAACVSTVLNGVYLPVYAMRQLQVSGRDFWSLVWSVPLRSAAMYFPCFLLAKYLSHGRMGVELLAGIIVSMTVLFIVYWRAVLPDRLKKRVMMRFSPKLSG